MLKLTGGINSNFDSSFSLTPNFSWVALQLGGSDHQSIATVLTVLETRGRNKLLKQLGDPRPTNHPSEEGC
jgi:hypothetical protein